jgi:hypothetical protein
MAEMVLDRKVNPPNPFGMGNQAVAPVEKEKEGDSKTEDEMPEKKLM